MRRYILETKMDRSVFAKILRGDLPGSFIYRGERVSAFLDVQGVNEGHCLVVPNEEVRSLSELDPEIGKDLFHLAHRIATAYRKGVVPCEGVNIWVSDGEVAGQEVPHVHLHVVPRISTDTLKISYQAEDWCETERPALDAIAHRIRERIDK